jgi:hypothetical protein
LAVNGGSAFGLVLTSQLQRICNLFHLIHERPIIAQKAQMRRVAGD